MFIGRLNELNALNKRYASGQFEFAVIYGRRRVGKTALIREFIKDKDCIFFTGVETNAMQNLVNFTECIADGDAGMPRGTSFTSFQAAFEYVFRLARKRRLVLVVDEYPYVARASKGLGSVLQMLIDENKDASKLFLILCGSSMSYMEDQVLAYKAPLYGRRTMQLKIQPFDFFESRGFFHKLKGYDLALAYGLMGGVPQYLNQLDDKLSIAQNIKNTYLNSSAFIFEEPGNLLKQELREPSNYNAVISAIATGSSKLHDIASKIGKETGECAGYIKNLIALGIVKKEFPYGEKTNRKSIYRIEDCMFRFWYRFIPENASLVSRGATELAYSRIESELSAYMGEVFEGICKHYLWRLRIDNKCAIEFMDIGRWWGANPKAKTQEEIDIMGVNQDEALFAECKWTNEKVDIGVLEKLVVRSEIFRYKRNHFYLFAKNGFTKGCIVRAKQLENVTLISYKEMAAYQ